MAGEPQVPEIWFDVSDLGYEEPGGILPHNVIPVNTDFEVWTDFTIDGPWGHALHEAMAQIGGDDWRVRYYAEQLGGPNDYELGTVSGTFSSSPATPHNYVRADTKLLVSGGIATEGTYRLTCTVDCLDANQGPNGMTGFWEGHVIQIHAV